MQDSNLRGQSPVDFESTSLTTRTMCRAIFFYLTNTYTKLYLIHTTCPAIPFHIPQTVYLPSYTLFENISYTINEITRILIAEGQWFTLYNQNKTREYQLLYLPITRDYYFYQINIHTP